MVAAAEAKAKAEGWSSVISVVDSDGLPIILERMDNPDVLAGVDLAPGKARTAALFRRESGALEDAVNGKRPALETACGFVLMRGGVPIVVDGQIVGAIGVSSDTPDHGPPSAPVCSMRSLNLLGLCARNSASSSWSEYR